MKNNMKKLIMVLSLGVLFVGGHSVLAANIWNQSSSDCSTVAIATIDGTTQVSNGIINPCWPDSSINANPGDWVNVRIYYHNSSDLTNSTGVTANNTVVSLNGSLGSSTTHSFSGEITSSQGNLNFGPVTVNTSTAQTLTFVSANWAPDQGSNYTQSGSGIMSSGLNLGSIAPGWAHQGSVVVSFKVGTTPVLQNCTISNFYANSSSINQGSSTSLIWATNNCTSASISPNVGSINTSGSTSVSPSSTTTYTLNAYGSNGVQQSQSVTVSVNQVQNDCSISYFNASPTYITSGNSSTLSWDTDNCTSVSISNLNYNVSTSGSRTVYPTYSTTYVLNAYGSNGSDSSSTTVSVNNNYYQNTTGTLTPAANSCVIAAGNSTCNLAFYWNTVNPVGTSSVTRDGAGTVANGNSGNSAFAVPYNTATYRLYNNANQLDVKTVSASCASNTFWNGSYCSTAVIPTTYVPTYTPTTTYVPTNTTVVHNNTTVIGTNSSVMLKIEDHFNNIKIGDTVEYTVTYKNISKSTLKNSMLQVVLPKEITFENTSEGSYASDTRTISVPLGDLTKGTSSVMYIQGKVDSNPAQTEQVVTNAVLIYTNTSGAQENAMAYVLNNITNDSSMFGAAAILSGLSSLGLLGLLVILLVILLIVYVVRRYQYKKQ